MTRLSLILILVSFVSCTLNPKDKQIKYGTQKEKDEYGNRNLQTYFNKEDFKNEQAYILYSKAIKESQDRDFKSAISYMKNALTFDATNKMILNDLGALYSENNMIDSAKFYTRLSLKLDSTNINALNNLGLYLYSENQDIQAMQYFDKAIKYDSTNGVSYMHKALAFQQLGQLDSCCKYLQIAKNCKSYDIENYLNDLIVKFCTDRNMALEKGVSELSDEINEK